MVIVCFDEGEQALLGGLAGRIGDVVDEFSFEGVEEALRRPGVPTISFPAHGLGHAGGVEHLAVGAGPPREAMAAGYSGRLWLMTTMGAALFVVIAHKAHRTRFVAIVILEGADR